MCVLPSNVTILLPLPDVARSLPISDVFSHHRALTTCHLANISLRLGRPLQWDPAKEQIVGDDEANQWITRPRREGYGLLS